ncbi:MAG: precorrin-4 C(11)-methyltransferase [Dehalococcoidia bacterium]|nr:Cobalt-precorrin-4 C(11)-methyltransferase [Chloroflexota bacterium]MBT9159141.1 Cobalt-precorrin-4 C(11)-methyltransferase [Chloroflexota bacterium]
MAVQVYFIGAGPGDPELLTIKGRRIIEQADVIIYADSLIDPRVCSLARSEVEIHKSASLSLEEITDIILSAVKQGKTVARLQSGDPSIYGAIQEQIDVLDEHGIKYEIVPGISSLCAAAASLKAELTVPNISQTVIITRMEGRTPVPERESLKNLAAHQATLAIFLSISLIERVVEELLDGGYPSETPVAAVYRVSWNDETVIRSTLKDIVKRVRTMGIKRQALILVGGVLDPGGKGYRSRLYNKNFSHGYRQRKL